MTEFIIIGIIAVGIVLVINRKKVSTGFGKIKENLKFWDKK